MPPLQKVHRAILIIILTAASFQLSVQAAAKFIQPDLQNDLAFYERLASRKKFSANDRLFHLYRLQDKYSGSGLDLSLLRREIDHWNKVREQASSPVNAPAPTAAPIPEPMPPKREAPTPELQSIQITETNELTRVTLRLSEPIVPQAKRVDDPGRPNRPLLWIDLPETRSTLPPTENRRRWDAGPLTSLLVSMPDSHNLRVELEMRGEPSFRIVRTGTSIQAEFRGSSGATLSDHDDASRKESPPVPQPMAPTGPTTLIVLMGQVVRPGDYNLQDGMTVMDLINEAGGTARGAQSRQVKIFRQVGSRRKALSVNLARIMSGQTEEDVLLRPGDVVLVPQKEHGSWNVFLPWIYLASLIAALAIAL